MALKDKVETTPKPEPAPEKVVEAATETPKEEPTKDKGGTTPEPADRWAGKSQDELLQIVRDQDAMIGKQSTVIDTQKKDLEHYETQTQTPQVNPQGTQFPNPYAPPANPYGGGNDPYGGYGGYAPQQHNPYPNVGFNPYGQPQQEQPVPFNYENPTESVQTLVRRELERERQARQAEETQKYSFELRNSFDEGRGKAYKSNPKLYDGIKEQVESGIIQGVKRGMFHPSDLRNEETWDMAAKLARLQRNEFSYLQPTSPEPVPAPHTEVPASMKEETEILVELNPQEQATKAAFGLTDEEARDIKKGGK